MLSLAACLFVIAGLITVIHAIKSTYDELKSDIELCNSKKVDEWECPIGEKDIRLRMKFCLYQCPEGTEYTCKKDEHHGLIEFCAKKETCEKGMMNKVFFDDIHQKVVTERTFCPEGFFEPLGGNCYSNCFHKHQNLKYVPNFIIVIFEGNASHSAVGHCDVAHGYVNPDNEMYINISLEEYAHFCYYDEKYKTRCPAGQRLLPDSTCVVNCADDYVPDRENYFKCVPRNTTITFHPIAQAPKTDTAAVSVTNDTSRIDVISSASPSKTTVSTTVAQQSTGAFHSSNWFSGIIIAGILLLLVAIFFIYKVCCKRKSSLKEIKAKNYNYKCVTNNFLPHALHGTVNIEDSKIDINGSDVKRKISSDAGLSTSDFDEEQSLETSLRGSPESGFMEGQNAPKLEVVAEVQPNQCRDQPYVSEEGSDDTECKRPLLQVKAVAKPVNPVEPMRQDDNVQMELLKVDGE